MSHAVRQFAAVLLGAIAVLGPASVRADDDDDRNRYIVSSLVSDIPGTAQVTDARLKNPWGIAFSPAGSPFWIADNGTGLSTLYAGDGTIQSTVVTIPSATGPSGGTPTGIVWNPSQAFTVPGTTTQAAFIFATEDGTISTWSSGLSSAVIAVNKSASRAVYKGLAFAVNVNGPRLFATNFHAGTVDVFDPSYTQVTTGGGFNDPDIPVGFAPFGIELIDGDLFVSYAKQDPAKHDDVAGPGRGFVDVFDTDGNLLRRFATRGVLNSPWGMTKASYAFGRFSGLLLIGNFGNGQVHAFTAQGALVATLRDDGRPLAINGLWKLTLGGGKTSSPDTLYFSAGTNDEADGTFGTITPAADDE